MVFSDRIRQLKYKKAIAGGLILAVIIILFRSAFAHFYHDKIREIAIAQLDQSTTADFSFSELDISLLREFPNIAGSFNNLTLTGKNYFLNDTIVFVPEVRFELNLFKLLLLDKIEVESVHLEKPRLKLIERANETNYDIFDDTLSADGGPINLELDEMSIHQGEVTYVNQVSGISFRAENISYSGSGKFNATSYDILSTTSIENFTLLHGKKKWLVGNQISAELDIDYKPGERKLHFTKSSVMLDRFKTLFDGSIALNEKGSIIQTTFSSKTKLKDILTLYPTIMLEDLKHISASGDVDFSGTVKGLLADDFSEVPSFDLKLKVENGRFKIDTLALPMKDVNIDLVLQNKSGQWNDTRIDLKSFRADLGQYPVRGRFKMDGFSSPYVDADIVSKIHLEDLEKIFPIEGVDMKGLLGFELKAKGKWTHQFFVKQKPGEEGDVPPFHALVHLKDGSFKYEHLNESFEGAQFRLEASNATGRPQDTQLAISDLKMLMNKSPLRGNIELRNLLEPNIKGSLSTDIDLNELKDIIPMEGYDLRGKVKLDIKADGVYSVEKNKFPTVNASLEINNGYVKSSEHTEPIENIEVMAELINQTGVLTESKLKISRSNFVFEEEPVALRGTILNFKDYSYDLFLDGKADLGRLTKVYPFENIVVQGVLDAHLELSGLFSNIQQKNYSKLKADGSLEIKDFSIRAKELPETISIHDAMVELDPEKIVLKKLEGKIGTSNVEMRGDIFHYLSLLAADEERIKADLLISMDTLNLERWLSEQAHVSDTTQQEVKPWMIPKNLDFTIDVAAKVVKHPSITVSNFNSDAVLHDGTLRLTKADFILEGGKLRISGDYNPYAGTNPFFDLNIEIQNLDIHRTYTSCKLVHDMAPAIEHTEGMFSGRYALKGFLGRNLIPITETIEGKGEIRIASAKVNGMKMFERISKAAKRQNLNDPHLKDLVIQTEIKDNQLNVKPFSMKLSGFNTDIEGVHDFNGFLNYIVKIELLPIEKLKIPFHVSGSYDDPKVALGKGHSLPEER